MTELATGYEWDELLSPKMEATAHLAVSEGSELRNQGCPRQDSNVPPRPMPISALTTESIAVQRI